MPKTKTFNNVGQECSSCTEFKSYSQFYKSKDKNSGHKSQCKDCVRQRNREYYWTPKGRKYRQEKSWRENGILDMTVESYEDMLKSQGGCCSICDKTRNKNGTRLCVDHDHKTGKVRGLLCHDCNTSLGKMNDDLDLLYRAVSYLENHETVVV